MTATVTSLFPLWAVLFSLGAFFAPEAFIPLKPAIVPLLGVVMFGMGITLSPADFRRVLLSPRAVGVGVLLQFALMPFFAWALYKLLGLPPEVGAGLVLVGSCPGGTASNVICYLARGNVALSITLTAVSTLASVVVTPLLTWLYIGREVPVPAGAMLLGILKIVIIPVALGVAVNIVAGKRLRKLRDLFPLISVLAIVVIIGIIVALNAGNLATMGAAVVVAVAAHNLMGLSAGYLLARRAGMDRRDSRTIAIEVGMQNSGLGVALAVKFFSPLAALPGAVFSVWHNLSGSLLASWWRGTR